MIPIMLMISACLFLIGCGATGKAMKKHHGNATARRIARAYGFQQFERIEAIRFTFNAVVNGKKVQRAWVWEPKTDRVTYKGAETDNKAAHVTYSRKDRNFDAKIDQWFINDQYWLLFPFHLEWDDGITVISDDQRPLPIQPGMANRITVSYPEKTGYTPGDVYELYYTPRYTIKQWVYHRGGSEQPTRTATWEHHAKVGPILISLMHKGADDRFRIWFSDVAVRLTGDDIWLPPLIF
ncbi:hypothetical protein DENIS_0488 [Desulfonema ishimotonii]|uniref:Uncharacterized protein n=2 Tax=Desulfonema ishimotonii TaxID=45657 RepID=A0A401FRF6_9BACT|nr:hypothetical protein DENIS_0488 [Desulfonema ishimotonii]